MRISPETTLREALRHRPRSIEVLEAESGLEFWDYLDLTVSDFCNVLESDRENMLARIASLPLDPHDRNASWAEAPGKTYPLVKEVGNRMESLEAKLIRHADLETGILLPRTLQMEEKLFRRRRESDLLD